MAWNKSNTKQCKYCKTEIPGDAKVCPNCKKKQGGIGKIILIVLIVLVVLGIIGGALGSSENDEPKKVDTTSSDSATSESKEEDSEEEQPTNFKPGETAELNGVQVTFVSATENAGNEWASPSDGNTFLICEFEITNNSDQEVNVSSLASFTAYCDDYAVDLSLTALVANEDKQQLDGTVAPGKKMNGIVGYEISADWATVEINFTPDFWSGKEIQFIATK